MKIPQFLITFSASFLITFSSLTAKTTVATDPVGYVTLDIVANGYTFIGTPLVNEASFRGAVVSVLTNDVTFNSNSFNAGEFNEVIIGTENVSQYIFEVTSGSDVGVMIPIVSNDSDTLTLSEDVSAFVSAGTTGIVRALHTLDSLFPNGEPLNGSLSAAAADEVLVFDSSSQSSKTYFYSTLANQWRVGSTPNGSRSILPNQAIYIKRKGPATSITFDGHVKMGTSAIDIFPGLNLVPNIYPVSYTLDQSGLYTGDPSTGVSSSLSAAAADEVVFFKPDGTSTTYFYSSLANEWRNGSNPAGDVEIPVGGTLLIKRKTAEGAFSWIITQPF